MASAQESAASLVTPVRPPIPASDQAEARSAAGGPPCDAFRFRPWPPFKSITYKFQTAARNVRALLLWQGFRIRSNSGRELRRPLWRPARCDVFDVRDLLANEGDRRGDP